MAHFFKKKKDAEVATVCIQNAEYLHENFGCTTWFQHHPGKDLTKKGRGFTKQNLKKVPL